MQYCSTHDQIADGFAKPLGQGGFGVKPLASPNLWVKEVLE